MSGLPTRTSQPPLWSMPLPTRAVDVAPAALGRGRGGASVHAGHWEGPAHASTLVLVHGLGGSHLNWARIAPLAQAAGWTVWAPDLAGFGFSELGGRSAAIDDQVDLLGGFIATVSDEPVRLAGNSMGGLLALLLAATRPDLVASLALVAPALPPRGWPDRQVVTRFALGGTPGVAGWWFRHVARHQSPAVQATELLQLCVADTAAIEPDLVRAHTELIARRRLLGMPERAMPAATRSLLRRLGPERARVWAAVDAIAVATVVVGGEHDRLVTPATLDRLAVARPDWARVRLANVGHVPMLEAPETVAQLVAALPADTPPWPAGTAGRHVA